MTIEDVAKMTLSECEHVFLNRSTEATIKQAAIRRAKSLAPSKYREAVRLFILNMAAKARNRAKVGDVLRIMNAPAAGAKATDALLQDVRREDAEEAKARRMRGRYLGTTWYPEAAPDGE